MDAALSCRALVTARRLKSWWKEVADVLSNVAVEPTLQPLSGERLAHLTSNTEDGARLDVRAQGFWGDRHQSAFFDVRVFNPLAPSNCRSSPTSTYRQHEGLKRRAYEQRVREILFYTTCFLRNRWHGSCRHHHVQETCLPTGRKASPNLQQNYFLAPLLYWILSCKICRHVSARFTLLLPSSNF